MADGREQEQRLEVYPPVHRLGATGKWIRDQLLKGILGGSSVLVMLQRLRSPVLNLVMGAVSFLGEEEFYTLLVPLVLWVCEARLGRLLALLMALAFYCTGFLKNLLCLPRPPVPPVTPLHRCRDWSLPSHHALLSVNIPWYIWFYINLHYGAGLTPHVATALFLAISLWSFLIMFSRMYLGVHSPADILAGGVIGCLLLAVWLQVDLTVDIFVSNSGGGAIIVFTSVIIVMLYLHPDPSPTTYIFDETVSMVGVAEGVVIGQTVGPTSIMMAILERTKMDSILSCVLCAALRFVLGLVLLAAMKVLAKMAAKEVLEQVCKLVGIPCVCEKRVSQVTHLKVHYSEHFITLDKPPPQEPSSKPFQWSAGRPLNLHTAVRLVTYTAMGVTAVTVVPCVFAVLGI